MTTMEMVEKTKVSDDALDLLFREARTYNAWLPKPVPDNLLHHLYATLKWGPTSANNSPARFVFIRSAAAKERLRPSLAPGNVEKTMAAPVTVIIAYDLKFYDKLPKLFPHYPAMRNMFVDNPQLIQETALRNSTLQGAYMILAARALYDWAVSFESRVRELLLAGEYKPLVNYEHQLGSEAELAVPTPDHYLPLLYIAGTRTSSEPVTFPVEGVDGGSVSMLAVKVG